MITPEQLIKLKTLAYVPEHLPEYVTAISQAEPIWIDDYIIYRRGGVVIFIGYPLSGEIDEERMQQAIQTVRVQYQPTTLAITAPLLPVNLENECSGRIDRDRYYRLDLDSLALSKKLRNVLKRADRDVTVESGQTLSKDHLRLIDAFIRSRRLNRDTRFIFKHIPEYVRAGTSRIYDARDARGKLIAFDIADFSAQEYVFYLFNFRSQKDSIPGASDLLMWRLIESARGENKHFIQMGLGINAGVTFFKAKWGAQEFLAQMACEINTPSADTIDSLLDSLLK